MDIAAWLTKIGLERYVSAFEDAEIDLEALGLVTEDDLKELGLPLGPRRKVLAARCEAPAAAATVAATPALIDAEASTPERRHLTVMFADLVDSTGLSVRIDPEILSELLQTYKSIAAAEVAHNAGTVAKYLGDGVLAYFGWPQAREDAAECALRCALAIVERVKALEGPGDETVACRIGIATGLVVVGGVTGGGSAREDTIAGEVLNLAARLEGLAPPDGIVAADSTYRLVGQLFECEDMGLQALKGFDQPVQAWRALRETAHTNRFGAARAVRTPLIGREQELAMMLSRWEKASQGEGRAILLLGEAGMGKSRLTQALHTRILETPHSFVSWQCSAFHTGKALYPVIEHLTAAAEIAHGDTPAQRLAKLSGVLSSAEAPLDEALPLFADLLSIPPEAGYERSNLPPVQRRSATIAALTDWLGRIAESKPLLLQLEDAHWIDATTLDLVNRVVASIGRLPIFALVTSRPGFSPPWAGAAQAGVIGLDRLSDAECAAFVRGLADGLAAPADTIEEVISKSDGNPLFLEELSLAVFDRRASGGQTVPDSLQSSLMARLDQLGEAKKVAQTCSVLGRRFAKPLLSHLVDLDDEGLERQLAALVENNIIYPLGRAQGARFEFKHALVRDAAYGSLLLSRRRELHERCARILESDFADVVIAEPELLAHHFAEANLPAAASLYGEKAGDRAAASVSYAEAISGYRGALDQNARTPPGADRDRRELGLLLKLGPAQVIIDGPQSIEVRETYARADTLAQSAGDLDGRFKAVWGLWFNANLGRNLDDAASRADELVALSDHSGDEAHQLEALHCRWSSALFRGEYRKASLDGGRGALLYVRDRHHRLHINFGGHDPGVCACAVQGSALSAEGRFTSARTNLAKGFELAEALDHPHSLSHICMNATIAAAFARDQAAVFEHGERLLALANKHNFPPQKAFGSFLLRWAECEQGADASLGAMRSQFDFVTAIAPFPLLFSGLLADQLVRRGEAEAAVKVTENAIGMLRPVSVGMFLPEIHRVRGVGLTMLGERLAGAEQFERAVEIARRQGSALFEMRALASALRTSGPSPTLEATRKALRSCLETVDTGPDWPDRADAEAVLG